MPSPTARIQQSGRSSDVLSVLTLDQLTAARRKPYGRRRLSPRMLILMWGLRVYAVLMMCIVGYQVAQAL